MQSPRKQRKPISLPSFRQAVTWACVSNVGFGLMSYLIKVTGRSSSDHRISIGFMWLSCGYVSLFVLLMQKDVSMFDQPLVDDTPLTNKRLNANVADNVQTEHANGQLYLQIKSISKDWWLGVVICIAGGLSDGLAQLFSMMSFHNDPVDAGPLAALITGDVILFAIFARLVYKESLNCGQWFSLLLYSLGLILMAHVSNKTVTLHEHVGVADRISAMFLGFLATVAFFGINASIRVGVDYHTSEVGGFILRGLTMGTMGIGVLLSTVFDGTLKNILLHTGKGDWTVLILPHLCGLSQALGIYALGRAFMHPNTSILVAIIGCNSIVVLVLGALIDHDFPEVWQNCGMALAVVSVTLISMLADAK
mmetsp:Transcript_58061/g.106774  ORF Transcript_58061/g.106774 Transcript_58061/m.106774 type:complete len:365 (-) Transcript_58061:249-1343(-)